MSTTQAWGPDDLDDIDDEMTATDVPCAICQAEIDPATGVCAEGHDDLDRADADRIEAANIAAEDRAAAARLLAAGAAGFADVTVTEVSE